MQSPNHTLAHIAWTSQLVSSKTCTWTQPLPFRHIAFRFHLLLQLLPGSGSGKLSPMQWSMLQPHRPCRHMSKYYKHLSTGLLNLLKQSHTHGFAESDSCLTSPVRLRCVDPLLWQARPRQNLHTHSSFRRTCMNLNIAQWWYLITRRSQLTLIEHFDGPTKGRPSPPLWRVHMTSSIDIWSCFVYGRMDDEASCVDFILCWHHRFPNLIHKHKITRFDERKVHGVWV